MCCCEKICAIDLLLCFANARVSFRFVRRSGWDWDWKITKTPLKVEKRTHAAASNARVFSAARETPLFFGLTLLNSSSSSYTNRQPQTLTNNPPPGGGIGTNGGAQVDDAARKQDALSYLRHLKDRLKDRKQTYDEFLEIMKEFKAQRWVFFCNKFWAAFGGFCTREISKRFWTRAAKKERM